MRQRWYTGATPGQWLALLAAVLGWAFDGFEMGVFPLVARPALIELLDLSREAEAAQAPGLSVHERDAARARVDEPVRRWNGVFNTVFLIGAALGGIVFGWLGDRIGRVRAMVFSVLTYALFTGLGGLAQRPWQLAALRFTAALGMGGEWSLGVALVMESWSAHARPVLAGLIGSAANAGFLLTALLSLALTPADYWRILLMVCVLPALLTFVLRTFVPESKQWEHAVATGPRARVGDIFVPGLRHCSLLGAGVGAVALLATWGGVQQIPLWIGQVTQGQSQHAATHAQICSALGATIGAFLGAVIGDRFPRRVGYFGLCVLSFAACEYLFLGHQQYDGRALVAVALVGALSAAFYGWLPLYLPDLFPTRVRATGQGFCYNVGRSLAAVGVLLTTFAVDLKGQYAQASALVCLVYVVGMVLAWLIPETRGQPLPE
jgi:MFS transporter, SHS family, sialic acid transporter